MKKITSIFAFTFLTFALVTAPAQFAPRAAGPKGPSFGAAFAKLFGNNQNFSASLQLLTSDPEGDAISMPGKISFADGKSRFEFNMSEVKGGKIPPGAATQMKAMGFDEVASISRPVEKMSYIIYPGLKSYVAKDLSEETTTNLSDLKIDVSKIGAETLDGHDCVKNKITITDKNGDTNQFTVWNAKDLKNFPLKIVSAQADQPATTMLFQNISFTKPAESLFEPPTGYTKYSDPQTLMQTEIMKKMGGGGMGMPRPSQ